ncbi:MAG: RNA polymerase sigma factor [Acholeplasmataceae bacterium]
MVIKQKYIDKLRQRDEDTFEYIYDLTKKGVYIIIFNIVKDHEVTRDIMQDVYLKMLDSIGSYQTKTNFYNWLLMIAKNQAIDNYRREKKIVHIDETDFIEQFSSQEETPEEKDIFDRLLSVLSEDERQIVLLKIVDNLKHKDIAALLNMPLGTVLWMYQEALKKMKEVRE